MFENSMPSIPLQTVLDELPKAQLQGLYLHWFPGRALLSSKDRLREDLVEAMTNYRTVRDRFDSLNRSQKAFLSALLLSGDSFTGTVDEIRGKEHGRTIEDYEVETILRTLQESGYIAQRGRSPEATGVEFTIPEELGVALRCTLQLDARSPAEILALNGGSALVGSDSASLLERLDAISDPDLRSLARTALEEEGGILTLSRHVERLLSAASEEDAPNELEAGSLSSDDDETAIDRDEWRDALEAVGAGTTGVLSLKAYGVDTEEQAIVLDQGEVYRARMARAAASEDAEGTEANDREISLGADLIIDLERLPELLKREKTYLTRDGRIYKKVDEKLRSSFVLAQHSELIDGSLIQHLFSVAQRLRWFEVDGQNVTIDALRVKAWRRLALGKKVDRIFEVYCREERGRQWSFHQDRLRELFLEELRDRGDCGWLLVRPFLDAVVARYLNELDATGVRATYDRLRKDDVGHRRLVVSLPDLHRQLSYWVLHRVALLGVIDIGYRGGVFATMRLSRLGRNFVGADGPSRVGSGPLMLLNPDFEILIYPEAPEEWSWRVSQFADRLDSDYIKRYRITRESVKRAIVAGAKRLEIVDFLEQSAFGTIPSNVKFALREWMDGVEFVRRQKALLLRAQSEESGDRLAEFLERKEIPFERLNSTVLSVRGIKNERACRGYQDELRDWGLILD